MEMACSEYYYSKTILTEEHAAHDVEVHINSLLLRHSHFSQLVLFHDSPIYLKLKWQCKT